MSKFTVKTVRNLQIRKVLWNWPLVTFPGGTNQALELSRQSNMSQFRFSSRDQNYKTIFAVIKLP